jgi:hypothetical protein
MFGRPRAGRNPVEFSVGACLTGSNRVPYGRINAPKRNFLRLHTARRRECLLPDGELKTVASRCGPLATSRKIRGD